MVSGLNLDVDPGNEIIIDDAAKFEASKITIRGSGNRIVIGSCLSYKKLIINLKGKGKFIEVGQSSKNINNLKIVSIRGSGQKVVIGKNLSLGGMELQLNDGDESIFIGDDCLFSWGIKMRTSDGHSVVDLGSGKAINIPKDIIVSDRVWVGEDVKLLKGAGIPRDSIVGAYSVVTKSFLDVEGNVVIGGFPAKIIKRSIMWDRRMPTIYNAGND